jgi:hypothetical protein
MAMTRKRLLLIILAGTLAVLVIAIFSHPYGRQLVFGPRIDGMPLAWWQDCFRADASRQSDDSLVTKAMEWFGIRRPSAVWGLPPDRLLELVLTLQHDPAGSVRARVARTLGQFADRREGFDTLVELLEDDEPEVRRAAASILARDEPRFQLPLPALTDRMQDTDEQCRFWAAFAIARHVKTRDPAAAAVLRQAALSTDGLVQVDAFGCLCVLAKSEPAYYGDIADCLREEASLRRLAPGYMRTSGPGSTPILVELLDDQDLIVRDDAIHALGELGPAAAAAIPALVRLTDGPEPRLRQSAMTALSKIDPERYPEKKNSTR